MIFHTPEDPKSPMFPSSSLFEIAVLMKLLNQDKSTATPKEQEDIDDAVEAAAGHPIRNFKIHITTRASELSPDINDKMAR